jgi:hypothetical protein
MIFEMQVSSVGVFTFLLPGNDRINTSQGNVSLTGPPVLPW